ncbi:hypothetical protein JW905_09565 [bacterium]|nr:hypothetical protein [candidate division CSSED10-310 bacterium]
MNLRFAALIMLASTSCMFLPGCGTPRSAPVDILHLETLVTPVTVESVRIHDRTFIEDGAVLSCRIGWEGYAVPRPSTFLKFRIATEDGAVLHTWSRRSAILDPDDAHPGAASGTTFLHFPENLPERKLNLLLSIHDDDAPERPIPAVINGHHGISHVIARLFVGVTPGILFTSGWHSPEGGVDGSRWMLKSAVLRLRNPSGRYLVIDGTTHAACFPAPPECSVVVQKNQVFTGTISTDAFHWETPLPWLPMDTTPWLDVQLHCSTVFVPRDCGIADDPRIVSLRIERIGLEDVSFGPGWYNPEHNDTIAWRWASSSAEVRAFKRWPSTLLHLSCRTDINALGGELQLTVEAPGTLPICHRTRSNEFDFDITLDPAAPTGTEVTCRLLANASFNPATLAADHDHRQLSFNVRDWYLTPDPDHP